MRLTLKAGARVANFEQLDAFAQHRRNEAMEQIRKAEANAVGAIVPAETAAMDEIRTAYRAARAAVHAEYDDIGRLAAYLGYDAVHAADVDYYAILNRTAVRVQAEDLR
jgi:vacuolar-type H+-ATPase subunit H